MPGSAGPWAGVCWWIRWGLWRLTLGRNPVCRTVEVSLETVDRGAGVVPDVPAAAAVVGLLWACLFISLAFGSGEVTFL